MAARLKVNMNLLITNVGADYKEEVIRLYYDCLHDDTISWKKYNQADKNRIQNKLYDLEEENKYVKIKYPPKNRLPTNK